MQFKEKTQISISYKKKKRLSATKQFGNTTKKKKQRERELQ
jgi:hypothetical protein